MIAVQGTYEKILVIVAFELFDYGSQVMSFASIIRIFSSGTQMCESRMTD
jgi:hypothetical protein